MSAFEDDCKGDGVKLGLGGEEVGEVLFLLEERGLCAEEEDEACVGGGVPLVPVACSLTSPRSRTANSRNCVSATVTVSTVTASSDCSECPPRDFSISLETCSGSPKATIFIVIL